MHHRCIYAVLIRRKDEKLTWISGKLISSEKNLGMPEIKHLSGYLDLYINLNCLIISAREKTPESGYLLPFK